MIKKKNIILASVLTLSLLAGTSVMAFGATGIGTDTVSAATAVTPPVVIPPVVTPPIVRPPVVTPPVVTPPVITPPAVGTPPAVVLKLTNAQKTILKQMNVDNQKTALATLVTSGIFTQAEADAIIAATAVKPADKAGNLYRTLTDVQKMALRAEMLKLNTISIHKLVLNGTITQAQADKILVKAPVRPPVVKEDNDKDKNDTNCTQKATDKIHGHDFAKTKGHDANKMHGHDFEKNNNSDKNMKNAADDNGDTERNSVND